MKFTPRHGRWLRKATTTSAALFLRQGGLRFRPLRLLGGTLLKRLPRASER